MNIKIKILSETMGLFLLLMASCSNGDEMANKASQNNEQSSTEHLTAFRTGAPKSRTNMERLNNGKGRFYWTSPDRIWAIDDIGTPHISLSNNITANAQTASAIFYLSGSNYTANQHLIYYAGSNATAYNRVLIQKEQTQASPNTATHFGESGDCGTATATKQSNGEYEFVLTHKASYLCFWPRTSNTTLQNARLMKIEVIADGAIAGMYELSATGLSNAPVQSASSVITLNTGGTTGFALTNTIPDATTNAAFMVIAPGTHTLSINYWIKLQDGREGTVVQALDTKAFAANTLYDINCDLTMPNCDSYVYGVFNDYPDKSDFSTVNDLFWYVDRGNPTLEKNMFWTHNGNVYRGGVWFKRKSKIPGFDSNRAPNGTDYITKPENGAYVWNNLTGGSTAYHQRYIPYTTTPASAKDYFFIPNFSEAKNSAFSWHGDFCSKNAVAGDPNYMYYLFFNGGRVGVHIGPSATLHTPPFIPKYAVFGKPED